MFREKPGNFIPQTPGQIVDHYNTAKRSVLEDLAEARARNTFVDTKDIALARISDRVERLEESKYSTLSPEQFRRANHPVRRVLRYLGSVARDGIDIAQGYY